jgi:hypothetical protein
VTLYASGREAGVVDFEAGALSQNGVEESSSSRAPTSALTTWWSQAVQSIEAEMRAVRG